MVLHGPTIYWNPLGNSRCQAAMLRDLSDVTKSQLGVQAPTFSLFWAPQRRPEFTSSSVVSGSCILYPLWRLTYMWIATRTGNSKNVKGSKSIQKWCFCWDDEQYLRSTWWHLCTAIDVAMEQRLSHMLWMPFFKRCQNDSTMNTGEYR